jgi:pyruvate dehydrogenase (quinone)
VEGLLDTYTELQNPDFARVAETMGFWARRVEKSSELASAVGQWLAEPGPALLDVVIDRFELVMPPHVEASQVFGTALYSARSVLAGRSGDVFELVRNAIFASSNRREYCRTTFCRSIEHGSS